MKITISKVLTGVSMAFTALIFFSLAATAQQLPQTTKEIIKGAAKVSTEQVSGTVLQAEGNTLVVRMSSGEIKQFVVPEFRKFIIDGKELTVHDLQAGTRLQASVTTTTTSNIERTTTIGTGRVFFVSGKNVSITLPNGENKLFQVEDYYRFNVNGEQSSVHDLRKGMEISAEKIVEVPKTELTTNIEVTGQAPAAKPED